MTDLSARYCAAFAKGSGPLLDHLYEPDAVLVPRPGTPLIGAAQRIPAHEHLLGFGLPITATTRHAYVSGDIALLIVDWSITGIALGGTAADVARRGADGEWRYVIDNPFGTA
jgi:ketosteroid isomerase-like protein